MKPLTVFKLGVTSYDEAISFQFELVERVRETKGKNSFLILLEHQPVITLGKNANINNILVSPEILKKKNIELKQANRGGDVTYHGPGQLIGYPIISLAHHKKTMRNYVRTVEQTIIKSLARFDISSHTKDDKSAGVWVNTAKSLVGGKNDPSQDCIPNNIDASNGANEHKIGFIGMRVSSGITYHGFSLNINNELDNFNLINPCGMKNPKITSLSELLGKNIPISSFIKEYLDVFKELFNTEIIEVKTHLSYIPENIPT
ncbi:MAG: lipoyl(octanoyl) transferase LipB [Planctomycetota bacterium]